MAGTKTLAERLEVVLKQVWGDVPVPADGSAYRIVNEADGTVKLWVSNADGDRISGRGADLEQALVALEKKVAPQTADEGGA